MLGLGKYCPSFLSNRPCHNNTCLNLHHFADETCTFTEDEIKNGCVGPGGRARCHADLRY